MLFVLVRNKTNFYCTFKPDGCLVLDQFTDSLATSTGKKRSVIFVNTTRRYHTFTPTPVIKYRVLKLLNMWMM